jgi:hypothetical protein
MLAADQGGPPSAIVTLLSLAITSCAHPSLSSQFQATVQPSGQSSTARRCTIELARSPTRVPFPLALSANEGSLLFPESLKSLITPLNFFLKSVKNLRGDQGGNTRCDQGGTLGLIKEEHPGVIKEEHLGVIKEEHLGVIKEERRACPLGRY